uniref:Uncharacterized protein n=1 Tax=Pyxicephalus adspersus TaxID=30357 RepID=A0AAV2ZU30_PYXAD|nr:TPA: hypothetical protein GDO54_016252 [Pyxicephalus adspersus]
MESDLQCFTSSDCNAFLKASYLCESSTACIKGRRISAQQSLGICVQSDKTAQLEHISYYIVETTHSVHNEHDYKREVTFK